MPQPLTDALLQQYHALRNGAAVADLSDRGEIELGGGDCASFLHNFCTNDINRLAPGQGCEAFFCNLQGKTIGHGYIFRREASLAVDVPPAAADLLVPHLDRYLIREDVTIEDRSQHVAKLLLGGPRGSQLLAELTGKAPADELFAHTAGRLDGVELAVRRIPYLHPSAFELVCDRQQKTTLHDRLVAAGATPCETEAVQALRIESGTPVFGIDITDANLPQEVARNEQAISFQKGCYLGQETVARIDALGHVNRQLVGVRVEGEALPPHDAALTADDKEVGRVTSAAWSPQLQAILCLAYVRTAHAKPGGKLFCEGRQAEVTTLPVC